MISITEALDIVLGQNSPALKATVSTEDSLGSCLAESVFSDLDLPSFDNSAMDGYAVCGNKTQYRLIGEVAAGATADFALKEGEAVRIFTGGKIPRDTTAVIMQEKVDREDGVITIGDEVVQGKNIRRRGEEIAMGEKVYEAGHKVTPASVGVLNGLGLTEVVVHEKPRVSIIATGDELIEPGVPLKEGQIYESNGATLTTALKQYGFSETSRTKVKDDFDSIKSRIEAHLEESDVVLISGGISVGDYDFVKQALIENGVKELFHKVKQKPGKPLFFGKRDHKYVFGLPGNPASSLISFYIYVLPLLQKLSGAKTVGLSRVALPIAHDYDMKSDRPTFFKGYLENGKVSLTGGQGSSMIHSLSLGNAIVFIEGTKVINRNDLVDCYLL
ncbi:MAG: molybdopterin molybdotransferase MoeA [Cyclobacteriaceae bacterium]